MESWFHRIRCVDGAIRWSNSPYPKRRGAVSCESPPPPGQAIPSFSPTPPTYRCSERSTRFVSTIFNPDGARRNDTAHRRRRFRAPDGVIDYRVADAGRDTYDPRRRTVGRLLERSGYRAAPSTRSSTGFCDIRIADVRSVRSFEVGAPSGRGEIGDVQRYILRQGVVATGVTGDARAVVPTPFPVTGQGVGRPLWESEESVESSVEGSAVYRFTPAIDAASEKVASSKRSGDGGPVLLDRIERVDLVERYSVVWKVDGDIDSRALLEPAFREAFFDLLEPEVTSPDLVERIETIRREDIDLSDDAFSIVRSIYNSVTTRLEAGKDGSKDVGAALESTAAALGVRGSRDDPRKTIRYSCSSQLRCIAPRQRRNSTPQVGRVFCSSSRVGQRSIRRSATACMRTLFYR